jgi:hypothetical protein
MIEGRANGSVLVGGVAILGIGLVSLTGMIFGAAIAPIPVAAIISLALHIIIIEMALNPNLHWEDVETQVLTIAAFSIGVYFALPATIKSLIGYAILGAINLWLM